MLAGKTKRCLAAFPLAESSTDRGRRRGRASGIMFYHGISSCSSSVRNISFQASLERNLDSQPPRRSRLFLQAFRQHSEIEDYFAIKQPSKEKNESMTSGWGETLVSFSHTTQSPARQPLNCCRVRQRRHKKRA